MMVESRPNTLSPKNKTIFYFEFSDEDKLKF